MEFSQSLGFVLAIFVGMTLGMLGSGGSILSVPILVYVMGIVSGETAGLVPAPNVCK